MTTTRLYWQDAYQTDFQADVVETLEWQGKPAAVLNQTCFYATSGGQPFDVGTLGLAQVLDVIDAQGRIIHVLDQPIAKGPVVGSVDWDRRFDLMQQHTGQHILSQAFDRLFDAMTLSFHLGVDSCTIDIDKAALSAKEVALVEDLSNRIVVENHAITVEQVDESELGRFNLRKMPKAHGRVRIVDIAGFDVTACGGTHVRQTGEIGMIHVRRWEKRKGASRVEFLCGWRALHDYRLRDSIAQELARRTSVKVEELPEAISRLEEAESESRHRATRLRKQLLESELPRFADELEQLGDLVVACQRLEDYDAGNMRYVAQHLINESGRVVLLAVSNPSAQLCFARSDDVDLDMGRLLREAAGPFGGRGGGRPNMAQGGGVAVDDLDAVLARARELIESK